MNSIIAFIKNISPIEWLVLAVIFIIIFGRKALIGLGKFGGETYKEVKTIKSNLVDAVDGDDKKEGAS